MMITMITVVHSDGGWTTRMARGMITSFFGRRVIPIHSAMIHGILVCRTTLKGGGLCSQYAAGIKLYVLFFDHTTLSQDSPYPPTEP
jgi:hypothetical protein